jgi:signal peptidase I
MEPSLSQGDVVVLLKAAYGLKSPGGRYLFFWSRPRAQDIVAVRKPGDSSIVIKRVSYVLMDSTIGYSVFVLGDNLYESIDSRDFGTVPMNNILGKVFLFPRF